MEPYIPVLVNVLLAAVTGVGTALWALWKAQHSHEMKMQSELAQIREHFVKESKLDDVVKAIRYEIGFVRTILVAVAQRLSIPTAVDHAPGRD